MITKQFITVKDAIQYISKNNPNNFFIKEYFGEQYSMIYINYDNGITLTEGIGINMEITSGGTIEIIHE